MFAVRVNEADAFADEENANDEYFDFEDISGTAISLYKHVACLPFTEHYCQSNSLYATSKFNVITS